MKPIGWDDLQRDRPELNESLENEEYEKSAEIWEKLKSLGKENPPSE